MAAVKIAIIGGGFTGLSATRHLAKQGQSVTLYEAGHSFGGLASGFSIEGTPLEKAYHHLFCTDDAVFDLCAELGIEDKLKFHRGSIGLWCNSELHPFSSPSDLLSFPHLNLLDKLALGLSVLWMQHSSNRTQYENIAAKTWLEKYSGVNAYRLIWEPLLKGKFHEYHEDIPMAWLFERIAVRARSKMDGVEVLAYPEGGFQCIVDALENNIIKLGGKLRPNSPVDGITRDKSGFIIQCKGEQQAYDKILCTLPSYILADLLKTESPSSWLSQLRSITYIGAINVIFSSSQSLSQYYWHNINEPDAPFLALLQHTNLVGKKCYNNKHVYYMGTYIPHSHPYFELDEKSIISIYTSYLKKVFPDFNPNWVDNYHVFKFKNAQNVPDLKYREKIPDFRTPLTGLYLSNFSQIYPMDRSINYAIKDGLKVANMLLSDLNT